NSLVPRLDTAASSDRRLRLPLAGAPDTSPGGVSRCSPCSHDLVSLDLRAADAGRPLGRDDIRGAVVLLMGMRKGALESHSICRLGDRPRLLTTHGHPAARRSSATCVPRCSWSDERLS